MRLSDMSLFGTALMICLALPAAGKRAGNRAYVETSNLGVFYARCVPAGTTGAAGRTEIYRVKNEGDELIDKYDVYPRAVVLGWSPIKGKVAVMAMLECTGGDWRQQEAIRFCLGGQVLKSYTAAELLAMGAQERQVGTKRWDVGYRVVGCEQAPLTNEYDFVVEVAGGKRLRFDITTGAPRSEAAK